MPLDADDDFGPAMSGREFYDLMLARGMPLYELVTFIAWARTTATASTDDVTLH